MVRALLDLGVPDMLLPVSRCRALLVNFELRIDPRSSAASFGGWRRHGEIDVDETPRQMTRRRTPRNWRGR